MLETLRDLYGHQEWADAVHWHVLGKHPGAFDDEAIRKRLLHIHQVQRAFLTLARGETLDPDAFRDALPVAEIRSGAVDNHAAARAFLAAATPERLAAEIELPWFGDPPCRVTTGQGLLQAATHSQYHRGQNATRLRELGGRPPTTDLIVWYWKGRPEPRWG